MLRESKGGKRMPLKQSIIFPEEVTGNDWARVRTAAASKQETVGEYIWKAIEARLSKEPAIKVSKP